MYKYLQTFSAITAAIEHWQKKIGYLLVKIVPHKGHFLKVIADRSWPNARWMPRKNQANAPAYGELHNRLVVTASDRCTEVVGSHETNR